MVGADAHGACRDGTSNRCCCRRRFASIKLVLLTPGRAAFVLVKGRHVIQTKALGRSCGLIPLVGAAESPPPRPPPTSFEAHDAHALLGLNFITSSYLLLARILDVSILLF